MSNYLAGHHAEQRAAEYLKTKGYKVVATNWKTRYCEIDIVAQKDNRVYFVEVKYRRTTNHGHGTDYITPRKLRQMSFAAEMWVHDHAWTGNYQLAVVSIDGTHITFIESI